MFDRIFANYLVEAGKLSEQNVEVIFSTKEERRARLGVIAVAEKVMTVEEANEVNQLQALYDKRFGDIAIENGFLTKEQVERLLDLQGNAFLSFVQAIVDHGCLSMDEIDACLAEYQKKFSLTSGDMENLKSCDLDLVIPVLMYKQPELITDICGVMLRTIYRLVDYRVYMKKPYIATEVPFDCVSSQELFGDHMILNAITGSKEAMKEAAIGFAGASFIETDEDSLDALCELINCINGLFASHLSQEYIDIDMKAPYYSTESGTIKGSSLLCVPIMVFDKELTITFTLDTEYTI